jgi:putative methyltransferase (TIGR04325 family)
MKPAETMSSSHATRTWKYWARQCLPPILVDAIKPPAPRRSKATWRGVYQTRADVPAHRDVYDGELVDDLVAHARAASDVHDPIALWHESLVLAAGVIAAPKRSISIVDFGGGAGSAFSQLVASLPAGIAVRYVVVETPQVCDAGRRLFHGDDRIAFATQLPADAAPDLVYANGVLQYLDDYADALGRLAALGAPNILLARLYAWDGPRFATAQVNLPGRTFASWFLNIGEVKEIAARYGYRVGCDVISEKRYQSDLPPTHRVERLRTLLLQRGER